MLVESRRQQRIKDLLLVAVAIQLSIVGQVHPNGSWMPLFVIRV
jgi:hypothetical protein